MNISEREFLKDIIDPRERDDDELLGCNDYYKWLYLITKFYCSGRERVSIVEIGAYRGYSAYTFMRAARDVGTYVYIDCIDNESFDGKGSLGRVITKLRDLFPPFTIEGFPMDSRDYKFQLDPRRSFREKSVDIFYVDGDHSYESCKHDLELAKKSVRDCGITIVDDMKMPEVRQAVNEFMKENEGRFGIWEINHYRGMAIII